MKSRDRLLSAASIIAMLAFWELSARMGWISPLFFPAPTSIGNRLISLLAPGSEFHGHLLASLRRLAIGSLIALPSAVLFAAAAELSPRLGLVFNPLIAMTYPIPKIAIFPLLLVIFGIGDASKIAVIAIGIFFLVFLSTVQGIRRLHSEGYMDIARVYRIPAARRFFRVILRGVVPEILAGLRTGLGYGLVMVIAGEFTIGNQGLGVFMWNAWDQFQVVDVYCGLAVLSVAGLALFSGIDLLSRWAAE